MNGTLAPTPNSHDRSRTEITLDLELRAIRNVNSSSASDGEGGRRGVGIIRVGATAGLIFGLIGRVCCWLQYSYKEKSTRDGHVRPIQTKPSLASGGTELFNLLVSDRCDPILRFVLGMQHLVNISLKYF